MGSARVADSTAPPLSPPAAASSAAPSPAPLPPAAGTPKRARDPEEEVYIDNLHSHKRYLSEIMASSLNGLSVGDTMAAEGFMESPARSDGVCYARDEVPWQYSPMSEDSDDYRYCETPPITTVIHSDVTSSPTSPVSPHRYQNPFAAYPSTSQYPLPNCNLSTVVCSHGRRGSDSEGRFPSSPNDMCHTTDLRRAALLRSVQMRTQPHCPPAYGLPFSHGQDNMHNVEEGEDRSFSCSKGLEDDTGYQSADNETDYIEDCSSVKGLSDSKLDDK